MDLLELENELNKLHDLFYKIALTRLDSPEDIEDVIAETKFTVFKYYEKLEYKSKFRTWVLKIFNNECNRVYRKNKLDKEMIEVSIDEEDIGVFDSSIEDFETDIAFEELIKNLNDTEKEIFRLYFHEQYTLSEIAEKFSMNSNTAKSIMLRGKKKIFKTLLVLALCFMVTAGIAYATKVTVSQVVTMNERSVFINKDLVKNVEYEMKNGLLKVSIEFDETKITKDNFDLTWSKTAVVATDSNDQDEEVRYPISLIWSTDNRLELSFVKYTLGPSVSIDLVSPNNQSITIMLNK